PVGTDPSPARHRSVAPFIPGRLGHGHSLPGPWRRRPLAFPRAPASTGLVPPRAPAGNAPSINEGDRQVITDNHGEEDRVEAVEDAAVGAEEGAGVLLAEVALQHRLEEVADRGDGGDRGADDQGVDPGEPVLVKA